MRVELNVVNTTIVSDFEQLSAEVQRLSAPRKAPKEQREILFVDNFTDAQWERFYADDEYTWAERVLWDGCPDCRIDEEFHLRTVQFDPKNDLKDWADLTRSASGLFVRAVLGGRDVWMLKGLTKAFAATGRPWLST